MKLAIDELLNSFKSKNVIVAGDIILDKYTFGNVTRISPEAPIPVLTKTGEKYVLGGAANVANNIASLGAKVKLFGLTGKDENQEILNNLLEEKNIDFESVIVSSLYPTILKHRLVSGNHQLLRVDEELEFTLSSHDQENIVALFKKNIILADCVIFSDYAKGFFSEALTQELISIAHKEKKLVFADLKPRNKQFFKGVDVIAPNLSEGKKMTQEENYNDVGKALVSYFKADVVLTRAEKGLSIFQKDGQEEDIPTTEIQVFDVSGAGDTVIATIALGLVSGLKLSEAAFFANIAAGIVVQSPGTVAIQKEDLLSALNKQQHISGIHTVEKLWGYEKWLENNEKYCCKLLFLKKGYQCSLHYHKIKDETFLITSGHVSLQVESDTIEMKEGNFIRIKPGTKHRFLGLEESMIMEISTKHDEKDTYRIEESRKIG